MSAHYIRDKRSPEPSSRVISKVMSANKAKDTKPELKLRKALWKAGLKGYRLNWRHVPGRPDIAFVGKKIAIFVHGCYWHRCPECDLPLPKSNTKFWKDKFERNQQRDKMKIAELIRLGWKDPLVIWECDINKNLQSCIDNIRFLFSLDN